jgi:methyltransferase (TIGR00027 family)
MKPGRASQTAVMVCMGRAVAHALALEPRFSDPIAMALLPDGARTRAQRVIDGVPPANFRERMVRGYLTRSAPIMIARTVAIDDAVREHPAPQLVILGAGLDSRAGRMAELRDTVVFEVDHPDTQQEKRARVEALHPRAKAVRFVAVDFTRDSLEEALRAAGHDPARPTTWIWEGVVMYLTRTEIEASLRVIERLSAPGSRLIVAYHRSALLLWLVGPFMRLMGEPLRSAFTAEAMRELLGAHGFVVVRDEDVRTIASTLSAHVAASVRVNHLRIATADYSPSIR